MPDDKQKEVFARNLNKYLERSGKPKKRLLRQLELFLLHLILGAWHKLYLEWARSNFLLTILV